MPPIARRRSVAPWLVLLAMGIAVALVFPLPGGAQGDYSTAIRVLREGRDFRARARAALALGSSNDRSVTPALIGALGDENPAVRAAAANALGRLGDPSALDSLRTLVSDPERTVRSEAAAAVRRVEVANPGQAAAAARSEPSDVSRLPSISVIPRAQAIVWPRIQYVVVVGAMENRSTFPDASLGGHLLQEVNRNLLILRGVAVIHGQIPPTAAREIQRRRLPKLRLEGSLLNVTRRTQRRQLSVRCEVSLMLMDDPGRNLRASLTGAATGNAPRRGQQATQERELAQRALTGAVRSAMSGAAQAISMAGRQ